MKDPSLFFNRHCHFFPTEADAKEYDIANTMVLHVSIILMISDLLNAFRCQRFQSGFIQILLRFEFQDKSCPAFIMRLQLHIKPALSGLPVRGDILAV